jgi:hypothetical protein
LNHRANDTAIARECVTNDRKRHDPQVQQNQASMPRSPWWSRIDKFEADSNRFSESGARGSTFE